MACSEHFLRKAVRQADSLLCATEGRIGGLGAEPRFRQENLAFFLGERVSAGSRFQGYVPCCNLVTVGIDPPLVHWAGCSETSFRDCERAMVFQLECL